MNRLAFVLLIFVQSVAFADHPFLQGSVTDDSGRPIEGATITMYDCIGTCFGGSTRISDAEGNYVFEEKTFRNFPHVAVSMPGRYHSATTSSGPKLTAEATDEPRRIDFQLGTPAALTVNFKSEPPEGFTQKILVRPGRGIDLHRYDLTGRDNQWSGYDVPIVPRKETYHIAIVRSPIVQPSEDRKVQRQRERESRKQSETYLSPGFQLTHPQRYVMAIELVEDENQSSHIAIKSLVDATNQDQTATLIQSDRSFGPPVSEELRQEALDLIARVENAAKPWNGRPPKLLSYQYDAVYASGDRVAVSIDQDSSLGPSWSDISRLRGFAYMPPLRWIFNQPENVTFHEVQVDGDRATIVYRLKQSRGLSAGLGVGPSWNGFFSSQFSAGTITIDPKRAVVLQHRCSQGPLGDEKVETFEDYVAIGDGFAPKKLRIQTDSFDFRLDFKIHKGSLWLLDEGTQGEDSEPSFKIENVRVKETP